MIAPKNFYDALQKTNIDFYCGVPDSLLKNFCAYVDDNGGENHIITASEGNAIALAAGYHMATSKIAAVYMQNSGLGNAINPLASLADVGVYGIPMLLIIGWRGEPGLKDEPQHVKQGEITEQQLNTLGIDYTIVDCDSDPEASIKEALNAIEVKNMPAAILVKKNTFSSYKSQKINASKYEMKRERALSLLLENLPNNSSMVSTTGKTSRELFELRKTRQETPRDFLTVGGMGHASSIALGVALAKPEKNIICIDGDGAALMHLGAMPIIASRKPKNFIHVLLNNSAHESVGGQPTIADDIDFEKLASSIGYENYLLASDEASVKNSCEKLSKMHGPILFEVKISVGSRKDLGRPTASPVENKQAFMESLND